MQMSKTVTCKGLTDPVVWREGTLKRTKRELPIMAEAENNLLVPLSAYMQ